MKRRASCFVYSPYDDGKRYAVAWGIPLGASVEGVFEFARDAVCKDGKKIVFIWRTEDGDMIEVSFVDATQALKNIRRMFEEYRTVAAAVFQEDGGFSKYYRAVVYEMVAFMVYPADDMPRETSARILDEFERMSQRIFIDGRLYKASSEYHPGMKSIAGERIEALWKFFGLQAEE